MRSRWKRKRCERDRGRGRVRAEDVEEGISGDAEKWIGTDWPCKAE